MEELLCESPCSGSQDKVAHLERIQMQRLDCQDLGHHFVGREAATLRRL